MTPEKIIRFLPPVFCMIFFWLLNYPEKVHDFVISIGAQEDMFIYSALTKLGIPFTLTIAMFFSLWVYDKFLWKLIFRKNNLGGWWIYVLKNIAEKRFAFGYFKLNHLPNSISIQSGEVFYFNKSLEFRGRWSANNVTRTESNHLNFIFSVNGKTSEKINSLGSPLIFDGFMELKKVDKQSTIGDSVWNGNYQDFGERRNSFGAVWAEKCSNIKDATQAKIALKKIRKKLEKKIIEIT